MRSVTRVFLIMEKSRRFSLGSRTSDRVREVLPNVKAAGTVNSPLLKYWLSRSWTGPSSAAAPALRFGRSPPPNSVVVGVARSASGPPTLL